MRGISAPHLERYFRALTRASAGSLQVTRRPFYGRVLGRGGPHAAEVVWIMSRVIAVTACGFMLAACSAPMPSLHHAYAERLSAADRIGASRG
jgi:hypothetical protein